MNILVTCAGRRHYLIEYFKDFLRPKGRIIGADLTKSAPALMACDAAYEVPPVTSVDYISAIKSICQSEQVDYIFSVNDLELMSLAKSKESIARDSGAIAVVSDSALIEKCNDKYLACAFLNRHNIKTPRTYVSLEMVLEAIKAGEINFPLIVKPRWGSASIALNIVSDGDALIDAFRSCVQAISESILRDVGGGESVIIQEYIEGVEYGVDILNSLEGEIIGFCPKKKIAMRAGETDKAITVAVDDFVEVVKLLTKSMRHIGNLDCDFIKRGDDIYLIEMNPRFGGGYPFSHLAGANHIEQLLSPPSERKPYSYEVGVMYSKCDRLIRIVQDH